MESGLAGRVRVGLLPSPDSDFKTGTSSFLPPLAQALAPGLVEVAGNPSSGRTSLACRLATETTARGSLAGWVDLPGALDPRSLRRSGTILASLLWVRPPGLPEALRCAELMLRTGLSLVVLDLQEIPPSRLARLALPVWTRLFRTARASRSTALLLSTERLSGAFPTLGLWLERDRALFEAGLFEGIEVRATVVRNRVGPPGAEHAFRALQRPRGAPRVDAAEPAADTTGSGRLAQTPG